MNPRISGQDTTISIHIDGAPLTEITSIRSFDITWKFQTKEENYVGETSPRNDDFFMGLSGRIEFDAEGTVALTLIDAVKTRAQNRALGTKISIKTVLQFPDGDRAMINIPQVFFGDLPLNVPSRTDYVRLTLSWQADNGRIVSR